MSDSGKAGKMVDFCCAGTEAGHENESFTCSMGSSVGPALLALRGEPAGTVTVTIDLAGYENDRLSYSTGCALEPAGLALGAAVTVTVNQSGRLEADTANVLPAKCDESGGG